MYFAFDEFEFDATRLELRRHGAALKVERIALRLLAALLRDPGSLVTKDALVAEVWNGRPVADNAITVTVARLRRALAERRGEREFVVTVYGTGYRFVHPVLRSKAAQLAPPPSTSTDDWPAFVGRQSILAELRHVAADARYGRGRVCVLMGEAGVGKTRLVRTLTDELARSAITVAWGFCREAGSTPPLSPWLQLAGKLLESAPEAARYQTISTVAAQLHARLHGTAASPSIDLRAPTLTATLPLLGDFARAFLTAAGAAPLVLVLEDLHRADAASLEVLSLLVDEIGRSQILVLATVRESLADQTPSSSTMLPYVLGHSNTTRLSVTRLAEADVLEYVAATIDDQDGKLGRAIYAKSRGNPLFMTELVRQWRREDATGPDQLELPNAALDVIRQHVASLDADTRSLLTAASVLGTSFELSVLQMVSGRDAGEIARPLDQAIANDLLVATPDSAMAFSFSHELVRAFFYGAIPVDERRRRHHETAIAIERHIQSGHLSAHPSELADHFYAALPDTDLEKTVRYCDEAARAASAVFANEDAARYFMHALAALALTAAPSPHRRSELLMRLAVYSRGSAPDVFLRSIREVSQLALDQKDVGMALRAAIMCHAHPELSALPGTTDALEAALAIIPAQSHGQRACALATLAITAPRAFSAEKSRAALREADELMRQAGTSTPLHEQVLLIGKLYSEGGPEGEASFSAAVDQLNQIWTREPKHAPMIPLFIGLNRAVRAHQRGHVTAANAALAGGLAAAREVQHPELLWFFERFEALAMINSGACEQGRQRLHALHRRAARHPMLGSGLFCAFDRAVVLPELGDPICADEELGRTLAHQPWDTPGLWALKVRALSAAGLVEEARTALEAISLEQLAALPHDSQYVGTLGHLARAAITLNSCAYGETLFQLLTPLDDYFASHASYFCEGAVPQLRGMLARMLGRTQHAHDLLERGLRMCEDAGFVLCAAETRLELALCAVTLGGSAAQRTARLLASEAGIISQQHQLHHCAERAAALAAKLAFSCTIRGKDHCTGTAHT